MVDVTEQIAKQRASIETARQKLQSARQAQESRTQTELRSSGTNQLAQRAQRKAQKEIVAKTGGEVESFEKEFEKEVASKVPKQAKQEYLDVEYETAKSKINEEISKIRQKIEVKKEQARRYSSEGKDDRADQIQDDISALDAKIQGYQKAISGSKVEVVQNVNSGYATELANYEAMREEQKNLQGKQEKVWIGKIPVETKSFVTKDYHKIAEPEKVNLEPTSLITGNTEYFNPSTQQFQSVTATGWQGTAAIRPPTPVEREAMDKLTGIPKYVFGDTKSGNILTVSQVDLKSRIQQTTKYTTKVEELDKDINKLTEGNIDKITNEWTGSSEDYNRYLSLYNQREQNVQALVNTKPTIKVGLFTATREVPVQSVRYLTYETAGAGLMARAVGETLGTTAGEGIKSVENLFMTMSRKGGNIVLEPSEFKYIKGKEVTLSYPYQTGGTSFYSETKGFYSPTTTLNIPEKRVIKGDVYSALGKTTMVLRKGGEIGGRALPYLNPAGQYIFLSEQAELMGGVILEKGSFKAGALGYLKEYPYDALALGTYGVIKGYQTYKWAVKPITIQEATRAAVKPKAIEFQKTKMVGGKEIQLSKYKITGEVRPPIKVIKTTNIRDLLGLDPLVPPTIKPAVTSTIWTPYWVEGNKPFVIFERLGSHRYATLYSVRGDTGAAQLFKGFEKKLTPSYIETTKLARIYPKTKEAYLFRQETKMATGALTRQKVVLQTEFLEVSKAKTLFPKDIEKQVLAGRKIRISAKTPRLDTTIYRLKETIVPPTESAGTFIPPRNIPKTPWTKTFPVEKVVTELPKPIIPTPKPIVPPTTIVKESTSLFPVIVGGTGVASIYQGQGTYEQTSFSGQSLILSPSIKSSETLFSQPMLDTSLKVEQEIKSQVKTLEPLLKEQLKPALKEQLKPALKEQLKPLLKVEQMSPIKERVKVDAKPALKVGLKPMLKYSLKQQLKQQLKQAQKQAQKQSLKQQLKPSQILKLTGDSNVGIGKALSQAKGALGDFEAFVTKAGKEVSIGTAETQEGAEKLLKGKLISTLSAGGFLTFGGEKIRATKLKSFGGGEFRLSKVSPFKIIEKKRRRLRKSTTGKEIQVFRKGSKSKSAFKFL